LIINDNIIKKNMRKITTALISVCLSLVAMAQSPYISKVYEYRPAPGQFVNKLPAYEPGDTQEDMNRKAGECLIGDEQILVSLGGYGGYVVFGFDHPIENVPNEYDFKVLGNAFWANANPNPDAPQRGGSCEPGIVMVSYDANGNGEPDDEWYELAGSEYRKPETIKGYRLTYHKPDENKVRTPDLSYPFLNDTTYIRWTTNGYGDGYLYRNTFHNQSYYPQWIDEDELVFEGTKLADNYVDESGEGSYYVQYAYDWGYADNCLNTDKCSNFNIEWAVDKDGNSVHLPEVHFIKVYTGVNQYCGWLGETSTEVTGAIDLHLLPDDDEDDDDTDIVLSTVAAQGKHAVRLLKNPIGDALQVEVSEPQTLRIYNALGQLMLTKHATEGTNEISCSHLPKGFYILVSSYDAIKFIKL
jgi:hypothetical protein